VELQMSLKMVEQREPEEMPRPHGEYRKEFLSRVLAFKPSSILDVGCGNGASLQLFGEADVAHCVGIDPEGEAVEEGRALGLEIHLGRAETLPFPDQSFDVVTLEYAAHHLENLHRGLQEAIRVARLGVVVLDCWYDAAIPSQLAAQLYDEWIKVIDRRAGLVHNPCPQPADLAAPFLTAGFRIDYSCRLFLVPLSVSQIELSARQRLHEIPEPCGLRDDLERLLDIARLNGLSDDGAIILSAARGG